MKPTAAEKKYGYFWLASVILILTGLGHFLFYFISPSVKLFTLTLIGKIPSSVALTCIIMGIILGRKATKIRLVDDSTNQNAKDCGKIDPKFYRNRQ